MPNSFAAATKFALMTMYPSLFALSRIVMILLLSSALSSFVLKVNGFEVETTMLPFVQLLNAKDSSAFAFKVNDPSYLTETLICLL